MLDPEHDEPILLPRQVRDLRGTVPSWHARDVLVDLARHTSGVVGVADKQMVGRPTAAR